MLGKMVRDPVLDFEQFVLAQQPASEPWHAVTDYSFAAREPIEAPQVDLLIEVFHPTAVLDAGCGYGHLMQLLRWRQIKTRGFDLEKRWPEELKGKAVRADLAARHFTRPVGWPVFDLVTCREVIEHLTVLQIARAVKNLVELTSKFVYVTTRFNPAPAHLLDVLTHDDLDPTHISLTNKDLLRVLFTLEGCRRRSDLEHVMDWQQKDRVLVYERLV